jgi:hypothetical protein
MGLEWELRTESAFLGLITGCVTFYKLRCSIMTTDTVEDYNRH